MVMEWKGQRRTRCKNEQPVIAENLMKAIDSRGATDHDLSAMPWPSLDTAFAQLGHSDALNYSDLLGERTNFNRDPPTNIVGGPTSRCK